MGGAIFLDRDGVINVNRADHVKSWSEFEFMPGALESIRTLTQTGLPIFVVTNQAIVNRGTVTAAVIEDIHRRMVEAITLAGGAVRKVYYCPHDSDEKCTCRKPEPGMLVQAMEEFSIDPTESFMVGDAWTDVQAGLRVGARSIMVITGRGTRYLANCMLDSSVRVGVACDLADATMMIQSALNGKTIYSTPRLRHSFHMALHPQELLVL